MDCEKANRRQLSRRGVLIGAGIAGAGLIASQAAWAVRPRVNAGARWLAFEHAWTGEKLKVTYYENGRYIEDAMKALDRLMRDHLDQTVVEMDPRLYDLLFDLNRLVDSGQPFLLISGYRSPGTNGMLAARSKGVARNSFHLRGWAADVRLPGRDLRATAMAAISLKRGGVGMYSRKSNFIHVDTGPVRRWNV